MNSNRVIFFIFDRVHLLDLAGAVTVFYESGCCGKNYDILYVSPYHNPATSSGLGFSNVESLSSVTVNTDDIVIVAGMEIKKWNRQMITFGYLGYRLLLQLALPYLQFVRQPLRLLLPDS